MKLTLQTVGLIGALFMVTVSDGGHSALNGSAFASESFINQPTGGGTEAPIQYSHSIPPRFHGRWDEIISDGCESREARFYFGEREFANFEVLWEVTRVDVYSPTEIDIHTTLFDEDANQVSDVWGFKLVDDGNLLTGRQEGAHYFQRCP